MFIYTVFSTCKCCLVWRGLFEAHCSSHSFGDAVTCLVTAHIETETQFFEEIKKSQEKKEQIMDDANKNVYWPKCWRYSDYWWKALDFRRFIHILLDCILHSSKCISAKLFLFFFTTFSQMFVVASVFVWHHAKMHTKCAN